MYLYGEGAKEDNAEAAKWYNKAVKNSEVSGPYQFTIYAYEDADGSVHFSRIPMRGFKLFLHDYRLLMTDNITQKATLTDLHELETAQDVLNCSPVVNNFLNCIDGLINDDITAWLNKGQSTFYVTMPIEMEKLRGVSFLQETSSPQVCADLMKLNPDLKTMKKEGLCLLSKFAHEIIASHLGRPSRIDEVIKKRLDEYHRYRSSTGFQGTRWGMTKSEVKVLYPKAKGKENF
jgi:hypothetical protein